MEYYRTAPTQDIALDLLDKTKRVQAAADRSKNMKGEIAGLLKNTVASIRVALIELIQRASEINTDERLNGLAREIQRLKKDNQELANKYSRLLKSYEDKEARERIRAGASSMTATQANRKPQGKGRDGSQRITHPPKGGEVLGDPKKGIPSRLLPKMGESSRGTGSQETHSHSGVRGP